ncbi:hypothetical protein BJ508DRAFT_308360 [Ascobolus immersus RN42]|uniref:F-box domain-containing protein n=1 Tax=Ascobolus immersus RN42 TaxID=1160509 RepID=A0A3N4I0D5_ASCIM|nr:hypothetical protein BJ508DRAFT_308360 [Ascobolus immersus RN42]
MTIAFTVAGSSYKMRLLSESEVASSRFLDLPTEIRLETYQRCTVLTLLQLASTSSALHTEVNAYPAIIRASHGFRSLKTDKESSWSGLQIKHVGQFVGEFLGRDEKRLWSQGRTIPCPGCTTILHCYISSHNVGTDITLYYRCDCGWEGQSSFDIGKNSVLHDDEKEECECVHCLNERYEAAYHDGWSLSGSYSGESELEFEEVSCSEDEEYEGAYDEEYDEHVEEEYSKE